MREDTKKFFYRSVSVKEGDLFSLQDKVMNEAGRENSPKADKFDEKEDPK